MTKAQERKVESFKRRCEAELLYGDNEFKKFDVKDGEYFVTLTVETGLKGDEGTMAQVFGRDRFMVFIGKRGGVRYYDNKGKSIKSKAWDGVSLYTLVLAYSF